MRAYELMVENWVYNKNIDKPMQVYPMMFSQMFRQTPDATTEESSPKHGWTMGYLRQKTLVE